MKYFPIVSVIAMFSGPAYAAAIPTTDNGFFFKPYVGADYQYTSISYNDVTISGTTYNFSDLFANSLNGGDVHIGARVHKNLGFEAGYFNTASESKSNLLGTTASSSIKMEGETFDALTYVPIGESQKFELIATLGVSLIKASVSITGGGVTYSDSNTAIRARIGAGAQYWLTDNINVNGIVRYQDSGFAGVQDAIVSSLGLNYQF